MIIRSTLTSLGMGLRAVHPHRSLLLITSLALAILLIAAMLWRPAGTMTSYNFYEEQGAVTWCSFALLALSSLGALFRAREAYRGGPVQSVIFWAAMTAILAFLAVDEVAGFHEAVGDANERVHTTGALVWGMFRSWNDIMVILYGVIALVGWSFFRTVLERIPLVYVLLALGFLSYAVHTVIDSMMDPPSNISVILEESFKVACGYFLALATWLAPPSAQGTA